MELKLTLGNRVNEGWDLLIVPYGIETLHRHSLSVVHDLLIVPYGIETRLRNILMQ